MVDFKNALPKEKVIKFRVSKNRWIKIYWSFWFQKKTGVEITFIPDISLGLWWGCSHYQLALRWLIFSVFIAYTKNLVH
jgi:hypothetical protein